MRSPCQRLCNYSYELDMCKVCKRDMNQILHWAEYTDKERDNIMESLKSCKLTDHIRRTK